MATIPLSIVHPFIEKSGLNAVGWVVISDPKKNNLTGVKVIGALPPIISALIT
jgi:hypothetical protein